MIISEKDYVFDLKTNFEKVMSEEGFKPSKAIWLSRFKNIEIKKLSI